VTSSVEAPSDVLPPTNVGSPVEIPISPVEPTPLTPAPDAVLPPASAPAAVNPDGTIVPPSVETAPPTQ
jgi:hypothetical protein